MVLATFENTVTTIRDLSAQISFVNAFPDEKKCLIQYYTK